MVFNSELYFEKFDEKYVLGIVERPRVIWTNGCFQNLHLGHKYLLARALQFAGEGGILCIGINSDEAIYKLNKKLLQPGIHNREQAIQQWLNYLLGMGMKKVAYSISCISEDPTQSIKNLKPDLIVLGNDYSPDQVKGLEYAGGLVLIKRLPGFKTGAESV